MKIKNYKILIVFILCLFMIGVQFLIACDPDFEYDIAWLKENVVSVEMIKYDNEELKLVYDRVEILPIDFDKIEIIEKLPDSKIEDFINDYSSSWKMESGVFFAEPVGVCVKMNFVNGDFMIITEEDPKEDFSEFSMIAIFDKDGKVTDMPICHYASAGGFEHLKKYFE